MAGSTSECRHDGNCSGCAEHCGCVCGICVYLLSLVSPLPVKRPLEETSSERLSHLPKDTQLVSG